MTGILIPIINILLTVVAIGIGIRIYILIREGALAKPWMLFISGSVSFGVMQIAATFMRSNDRMSMGNDMSLLGLVHDASALFIIVFFLSGSYLQYRALTNSLEEFLIDEN